MCALFLHVLLESSNPNRLLRIVFRRTTRWEIYYVKWILFQMKIACFGKKNIGFDCVGDTCTKMRSLSIKYDMNFLMFHTDTVCL